MMEVDECELKKEKDNHNSEYDLKNDWKFVSLVQFSKQKIMILSYFS